MALLDQDDCKMIADLINNRPPVASCRDQCVYRDDDKHDKSHDVLDKWIELYNKREVRNEKIKASVIGGLIISAAGSIGTGAYTAVQYLREHLK